MNQDAGIVALIASMRILEILARRGLLSPSDVEAIHDDLMELAEAGDPTIAGIINGQIAEPFAQIRQIAAANWKAA